MRINQKELYKLDKTEVTLEELLNTKCIKENFLEKKLRIFYMMSLRLIHVPNNDSWKDTDW